jgi:hypothetical protein
VRISGSYSTRGVVLRVFTVTAPPGARITVRCAGRGCPYVEKGPFGVRSSEPRAAGAARIVSIGGFRRRLLRPGVRLQVFVEQPGLVGKFTRFTIRRDQRPRRADRCMDTTGAIVPCG